MVCSLKMVTFIKATCKMIFVLLSILPGYTKSEKWKHNDQSQIEEGDHPDLISFLEHVLEAQDDINWIKKMVQHEGRANKEQCLQYKSQPFSSSSNFETLGSDNKNLLNVQARNIRENEWSLQPSGEDFAPEPDFMNDAGQTHFRSKNMGDRFKRRTSDQLDEDPKLKNIIRNNIDNFHRLNLYPELTEDANISGELQNSDRKDDTTLECRGAGKIVSSNDEQSVEGASRIKEPSDSVMQAYFAGHMRRQGNCGRSTGEAHSRDVRVDIPDLVIEPEVLKPVDEKSEQEHQRLQLEDADGLLKGTIVESPIGSVDNQMTLDKEKTAKHKKKVSFQTAPIKESKITSRDSQSQEHELPQQIKLDLLNDPIYNKVDLKNILKVNIGSEKREKNLIASLAAESSLLENKLSSSVHQCLSSFDQQKLGTSNNEASELAGAQIFLDKKDTNDQQRSRDEPAETPKLLSTSVRDDPLKMITTKDSDISAASETKFNIASNEKEQIRLTRSNRGGPDVISIQASHQKKALYNQEPDQNAASDQIPQQINRDKRTVVKRPGAIWQENVGNEDLDGSEDEGMNEGDSDLENEGKGAISFESDEGDQNNVIGSDDNGTMEKPSSAEEDLAVGDVQESLKGPNKETKMKEDQDVDGEPTSAALNKISHLDDAARLKASYNFFSKYAPPLETKGIQKSEGYEEGSDTNDSHLVRNERAFKITHLDDATSGNAASKDLKNNPNQFSDSVDEPSSLKQGFFQPYKEPKLDNTQFDQDSIEHNGQVLHTEDVPKEATPLLNNNDNMRRKRKFHPTLGGKSYSSRSLLSVSVPKSSMQDIDVDNDIKAARSCEKHTPVDNERNLGFFSEPLDIVIDRELHSGNLPPLIRVKRFVTETDFDNKEPVEVIVKLPVFDGTIDQHCLDNQESSHLNVIRSAVNDAVAIKDTDGWESAHGNMIQPPEDRTLINVQASNGKPGLKNVKELADFEKPVEQNANDWESIPGNVEQSDGRPDKQRASNQGSVSGDVKRSAVEADLNGEQAEYDSDDQEAFFETIWHNGAAQKKIIHGQVKQDHSTEKSQKSANANHNKGAVLKGSENFSPKIKPKLRVIVRSIKHARRNEEDEDEKEFESADVNTYPKNDTKRSMGQEKSTVYFDNMDALEMDDGSLFSTGHEPVEVSLDENNKETPNDQQDNDFDIVKTHALQSSKKTHPTSKDSRRTLKTKSKFTSTGNGEKIETKSEENVRCQGVAKDNELSGARDKLLDERYKRASNNYEAETENVKSKISRSPLLNGNNLWNENSQIIPKKIMMEQCSSDSLMSPVTNQVLDSSKGVALVGFDSSKSGQLMHMKQSEPSNSLPYGTDSKDSILDNIESGPKNLFLNSVDESASGLDPHCTDNKPDNEQSLSPYPQPSGQSSAHASSDATESERQLDRRRGIFSTPKPNQLEASDEYNGELDDGQLGTEIVQTIFQQVDKTPRLKQRFSSLSLRYRPSDVKETKENNCQSQKMIHQIMQLIDQSVDEGMKSRTCSPLPDDLDEFIAWLMKNESRPSSSTESPFIFPSPCQSECAKGPVARHLGEPKSEDIEREIAVLGKLICYYNKLAKCDQEQVKLIFEYLCEQKTLLTSLLEKTRSKCDSSKKPSCPKKPGCDSDLEQKRLVEETMDSVGLGPIAMHSSNIGDKFISKMSLVSSAGGASVARRSVGEKGISPFSQESGSGQRYNSVLGGNSMNPHRLERDAAFDSSQAGYNNQQQADSDDGGLVDWRSEDDDDDGRSRELKRISAHSRRYNDDDDRDRSVNKAPFMQSRKYQRLVARAAELKRRKRDAALKKRPSKKHRRKDRNLRNNN